MKPEEHINYTLSDYYYLTKKGYTDAEIINIWDDDINRGKGPLVHRSHKMKFEDDSTNITRAILAAWESAKVLGIDFESFEKHIEKVTAGTLADCED